MDQFSVRKVKETSRTVTIEWDPVPGAYGYVFFSGSKRVSNSWDANKVNIRLSKSSEPFRVVALTYKDGVFGVAQGIYSDGARSAVVTYAELEV